MDVKIGIEKECLVFDEQMQPVDLEIEHLPKELTVDFANHQLEVVGNVCDNSHYTEAYLNELLTHRYLQGRQIWPLSTPLAKNQNVKYDKLDSNYRHYLAQKYGVEKMLYSGIHFNYSNQKLQTEEGYFLLMKKIFEYMPIIMQFTSFTPYAHNDLGGMEKIGENYGFKNSISLRASNRYGYSNLKPLNLDFSSLDAFKDSKKQAIDAGELLDEREIYTMVRLKKQNQPYVELRFLDLNPFYLAGISETQLVLISEVLDYLIEHELKSFDFARANSNIEQVALGGRDHSMQLLINGKLASLEEHTCKLFSQLIKRAKRNTIIENLKLAKWKYVNNRLDIDVMIDQITNNKLTLMQFGERNIHKNEQFVPIYEHLDMELSTKLVIKEAKDEGYTVDIESESQNIIKISNSSKSEYVVQATKTSLDKYVNVLLMNDKFMTKKILSEANINVPAGIRLSKGELALTPFDYQVVVKPLDTNFGLGITICDGRELQVVNDAVKYAYGFSDEVLIEQFIKGQEYRFLVIDNQVVSVITRKNANVVGDGNSSIKQLIDYKNNSPLRGENYRRPLEKIIIDDDLIRVLKMQGYELTTILPSSQSALLRQTSNVSQGGDSYEVLNLMTAHFKKIAVDSAKALDVAICGIDMIIDMETGKWAIIEANYNPALHMHMYPYKGRGVNVAKKVTELIMK